MSVRATSACIAIALIIVVFLWNIGKSNPNCQDSDQRVHYKREELDDIVDSASFQIVLVFRSASEIEECEKSW